MPFVMLTAEHCLGTQDRSWNVVIKPHAKAATRHTENEADMAPVFVLKKLPKHCCVKALLLNRNVPVRATEVRAA